MLNLFRKIPYMSWYLVIRHTIDQTFHVSISLVCTNILDLTQLILLNDFIWIWQRLKTSQIKILECSSFCVSDQQKKIIYNLVFKVIVYFLIFSFEKCKIIDGQMLLNSCHEYLFCNPRCSFASKLLLFILEHLSLSNITLKYFTWI